MALYRVPRSMGDDAPAPPRTLSSVANSSSVSTGASMALGYHGYKRTGSIGWALVYAALGKLLPVVAVPVAVAQGFGARKPCP